VSKYSRSDLVLVIDWDDDFNPWMRRTRLLKEVESLEYEESDDMFGLLFVEGEWQQEG
jgi:hypothetical protein